MNQTCAICGHQQAKAFDAIILHKYEVAYFLCGKCGLLSSEDPFWLDESYSEALAKSDTGLLSRAMDYSKIVSGMLGLLVRKESTILDFGGGYGLVARALRDIGHDCFWYDKYAENIFARGFEGTIQSTHYDALISLEVIEHLRDPLSTFRELTGQTTPSVLLISTMLYGSAPPPADWWYYGFEHGQHISLFSNRTIQHFARALGYQCHSCGVSFHVLTQRPLTKFEKAILRSPRLVKGLQTVLTRSYRGRAHSDHELFK